MQNFGVYVNDADASKLCQNDTQLVKFNAYTQDGEDDDLMNPATPITSVRSSVIRLLVMF